MTVDVQLENADRKNYDGLVIPGGVINPDLMRRNDDCVEFAQQFLEQGKVVAAICHEPQ